MLSAIKEYFLYGGSSSGHTLKCDESLDDRCLWPNEK